MPVSERASRGWLVLAPRENLVFGGPAENFELLVQRLFRQGHRLLVADLGAIDLIDSAGIRALVRAHTTAQRAGGHFRVTNLSRSVSEVLSLTHLDEVLEVSASVDDACRQPFDWRSTALFGGVIAASTALVLLGWYWSSAPAAETASLPGVTAEAPYPRARFLGPFTEVIELAAALTIGFLVTAVHKRQLRDRQMSRSMEQAQVLLCVSGAMMMIIIGNSLARAFGIAGAAGIIRFRTPVEDPKDVTILFLLMGLGMACGMGALSVAGLGMVFLCGALLILDRAVATKPRIMHVEITAKGHEFPLTHVFSVLTRYAISYEPREVSQEGDETVISYKTALPLGTPIEEISAALVADGKAGVSSVQWESPKKP
jgi:anti-anti-sigma factor